MHASSRNAVPILTISFLGALVLATGVFDRGGELRSLLASAVRAGEGGDLRHQTSRAVRRPVRPDGPRPPFPRYSVRDLGPVGAIYRGATGLNASGQVLGSWAGDDRRHPIVWVDGDWSELPTPGRLPAWARAINDAGHAAGCIRATNGRDYSACWFADGDLTVLGTLGGSSSIAHDINNADQIVGVSSLPQESARHAFLYQGGRMLDLGTLGGPESEARAINRFGQIVGDSQTPYDWSAHAFLYREGRMQDLGTLGGGNSQAWDINDAGDIVGGAERADGMEHAFLYREGEMVDLQVMGGVRSVADAINNHGQIVGSWNSGYGGEGSAFLCQAGVAWDLNRLIPHGSGWRLATARDINDAGQIVGSGIYRGTRRAYLLSPERPKGERL